MERNRGWTHLQSQVCTDVFFSYDRSSKHFCYHVFVNICKEDDVTCNSWTIYTTQPVSSTLDVSPFSTRTLWSVWGTMSISSCLFSLMVYRLYFLKRSRSLQDCALVTGSQTAAEYWESLIIASDKGYICCSVVCLLR